MQRKHIHFAKGTFKDRAVISGLRYNAEVHIYIDLKKALDDGIKFYESENGVILTPGNDNGFLDHKYFAKVIKVGTGECNEINVLQQNVRSYPALLPCRGLEVRNRPLGSHFVSFSTQ